MTVRVGRPAPTQPIAAATAPGATGSAAPIEAVQRPASDTAQGAPAAEPVSPDASAARAVPAAIEQPGSAPGGQAEPAAATPDDPEDAAQAAPAGATAAGIGSEMDVSQQETKLQSEPGGEPSGEAPDIEVWRPARREHHGQRRTGGQRSRGARRGGAFVQRAPGAGADGESSPQGQHPRRERFVGRRDAARDAASGPAEGRSQGERPDHARKPQDGRSPEERSDTRRADRRPDQRKGDRFGGEGRQQDGHPVERQHGETRAFDGRPGEHRRGNERPPQRFEAKAPKPDRAVDPDSPFAKLAALKAQMDAARKG